MVRIVRGFITPYYDRESGRYVDALDVTERIKNIWRDTVSYLEKGLEYLAEYYIYMRKEAEARGYRKLEDIIGDKYMLIADVITWLLKAPLFRDPIEGIAVSPYKLYIMLRLLPPELLPEGKAEALEDPIETLKTYLDIVAKHRETPEKKQDRGSWSKEAQLPLAGAFQAVMKLINHIDREKHLETVEQALLFAPADTRPGFNTVNLITHLTLTSGISAGLKHSPEIVLASLLHDLGKPIDPENHIEKSVEVSKKILETLVEKILSRDEIEEILELIRRHHDRNSKVREADQRAAAERNLDQVESILKDKLREVASKHRELIESESQLRNMERDPLTPYKIGGRTAWRFWRELSREEYLDLTESYVREARRKLMEGKTGIAESTSPTQVGDGSRESDSRVAITLIDIRGIQSAIRRTDELKILIATSYAIDFIVMAYIPYIISRKLGLPLTSIVYSAGGTLQIVHPNSSKDIEKLEQVMEDLNERINRSLGINLVWATTPYTASYRELVEKLGTEITNRKIILDHNNRPKIQVHNFQKPCEYCGINPATQISGAEDRELCIQCAKLSEVGEKLHFKYKLGLAEEEIEGVAVKVNGKIYTFRKLYSDHAGNELREAISRYLIEYHAGHDPQRVEKERTLNYAIIALDGNLMGAYILRSLSFSDVVEKSVRIDLALKRALRETVKKIIVKPVVEGAREVGVENPEKNAAKEAIRIYTGLLYMGGDDALLITPAWAAIPISIGIAAHFHHYMGRSATLGIGIAAAPPKHSIWGLVESSKHLEEKAKAIGREITIDLWRNRDSSGIAAVSFTYTESTSTLTPSKISPIYREHQPTVIIDKKCVQGKGEHEAIQLGLGVSAQPYKIDTREGGIIELLRAIVENVENKEAEGKDIIEDMPQEIRGIIEVAAETAKVGWLLARAREESKSKQKVVEKYESLARSFREVVLELQQMYIGEYKRQLKTLNSKETALMLAYANTMIYAKRQEKRIGNGKSSIYRRVIEIRNRIESELVKRYSRHYGTSEKCIERIIQFPLHDLYTIIKIIGGGSI